MDSSSITSVPGARKKRKRVGRGPGSGHGKTSGKGHKGQKARSGYSRRSGFEGGQMPLHRRLPKRGFHHEARFPLAVVNLDVLERRFEAGSEVSPETVAQAGLVDAAKTGIKVLARGELTKALKVRANAVSAAAQAKIEAAGGSVELITVAKARARKRAREA